MGTTRRYFRYLLREGRTKNALVMAIHDERLAAAATQLRQASAPRVLSDSPPLREGPGEGAGSNSSQKTKPPCGYTPPHPPLTPLSRVGDQGAKQSGGDLAGQTRLIDIGCGTKPYRELFAPYVSEHVGLDVADTRYDAASVDLVGTATAVPVADGAFDVVLSTSNLEHIEEPAAALDEWARVLRPGGRAIVTVPMHWHLHDEPRDFYRFTQHGLEHLFAQAGFTLDRLETLGGFWTTAATMTSYYLFKFNRGPLRWLGVIRAVSAILQTAALILEKIDPAKKWACMLLVVATKPGGGERISSGGSDG